MPPPKGPCLADKVEDRPTAPGVESIPRDKNFAGGVVEIAERGPIFSDSTMNPKPSQIYPQNRSHKKETKFYAYAQDRGQNLTLIVQNRG